MSIAVHPHIRGAYCSCFCPCPFLHGSSPHTWGILQIVHVVLPPFWFIPTYVGHTRGRPRPPGRDSVHPHIRGAYVFDWFLSKCLPRFIPTYVGHTIFTHVGGSGAPVHPHIRGAYGQKIVSVLSPTGSSPHTWGIHWTTVRKMAGFSHFSYDFTRKSYFVQGLVFFGVIGAEASLSHRRGRNQCLPGAHGGSVRNL